MRVHRGVQAEVLLSLALVMVTGTGLLAAVFLELNHSGLERLHGLIARGSAAASANAGFERNPPEIGLWWALDAEGRTVGLNASTEKLDRETLNLAEEAIGGGETLVQSGAPWEPIRLAVPRATGRGVFVGRIDAAFSGAVLAGLLVTDVLIFCLFGVTLLRRRVVGPVRRLAKGVREIGEGDFHSKVPVEGAAEIEALAEAFNEMQVTLASRTNALEKAVVELRQTNGRLLQAREGLDRAERLAMVGSLAAGVAHEVGNPMAALLAFLDVARQDDGLGEKGQRCLGRASEQGERVRIILRQLLDFSRTPQVTHGPIELEPIARQAIELVAAQKRYAEIEFELVGDPDLGTAIGDESLVSQVLLNLVINAAGAVLGEPRQRIRVKIEGCVLADRSGDSGLEEVARFDAIACRVCDAGPGVARNECERIFDPFFTTQPPGEGTGLGLANARRLAEEMRGRVELDPAPGELGGASFRLVLPRQAGGDSGPLSVRVAGRQSRIP